MSRRPPEQFHAFTTKHDGLANRLITEVGITAAFDPNNPPDPLPPEVRRLALWDTGATNSVLTPATVAVLGLVPVGVVDVNHVGGVGRSNVYLVNFKLPNNVGVIGVPVSECSEDVGAFGAIIGMDIIAQGDFSVTNTGGKTVLSFRIPSLRTIDYVVEAHHIKFAGTPRNAPCPCGSGRKFKYCHGA